MEMEFIDNRGLDHKTVGVACPEIDIEKNRGGNVPGVQTESINLVSPQDDIINPIDNLEKRRGKNEPTDI